MNNILFIDTSDNTKVKIGLGINGKKEVEFFDSKKIKTQPSLVLISDVLKKNNLKPKDLTQIKINTGPGSYTGLRVGVAIANALSYLLKIPVNGKKIGDLESPVYN